ncbi:uncharacterized protein BJX67DRAFT_118303 [Aspergillus lucknowensis]|uniref:Uncharacterized protein n=1 Tax=Aspergillus lucknowensis TaxID=176173 RepID=A0ABR4LQY9_9EURO
MSHRNRTHIAGVAPRKADLVVADLSVCHPFDFTTFPAEGDTPGYLGKVVLLFLQHSIMCQKPRVGG